MYIFFRIPQKEILEYNIEINTFDKNLKSQYSKLTYTNTIKLKKETLKGYVVNFKRSDILLNDSLEQSPMNELLMVSGEVLNDLDLEISKYGEIIKIRNIKAIQEYWKDIRFKIVNSYKGNIVENIVINLDQKINDETLFIQSLYKDLFFFNYLRRIYGEYKKVYGEYKNEIKINDEEIIGFIETISLYVMSKFKIAQTESDKTLVNVSMRCDKETVDRMQSYFDPITDKQKIDMGYECNYQISANRYIESFNAMIDIHSNTVLYKKNEIKMFLKNSL